MAVIIRLQNLAWSATAPDVRKFFSGLSIPNGGVHIVGGDEGDCFVAFATDEDARKAMKLDGGRLANQKIKLLLSSKTEMEEIIAIARGEKPAQPPASASASSVASAPSRDPSREPSRHRSRSRSPRRSHISPDRARNSRRDTYNRDMDRTAANRGTGSRDTRGVPTAVTRVDDISAELREAHRREIAKVDPLPPTGSSQASDRRVLLQSSADALNSSNAHVKLYGTLQLPTKERNTLPVDMVAQMGSKMPGGQTVAQVAENRWREETAVQVKGPAPSDPSQYGAMQASGALEWGSSVAVPPAADRPVHRKSADSWPAAGQSLQSDPRGAVAGEPPIYARSIGAAFPAQSGNGVPLPPPAPANKGRSGPGGRPPALLPTPPDPVLRPQLEPEVAAQLPAGLGSSNSDQLSMRRGPPPRVTGAAAFDSSAAVLSLDDFNRPAAAVFERPSALPVFDRPAAVATFDHEHGVSNVFERSVAPGFDVLGTAFDLPEARPYPPATATPSEPAVRIYNLGPSATKKGLRSFFAKGGVHPVDIKLVRRWHGDNIVGFVLFSSVAEAATVITSMTGLAFEGGQPLSFEPCSRAEYEAIAEHGAMPATRDSLSQLCVTFTDLPPTATIKDLEELLAQTEYVLPSLYVEHDPAGICTGAAYVEMGNLHDYETVLAMRKRVAIHGQIIRVRPINKDEMKALVVHHKDSLLAAGRENVIYLGGGADMVQPPPLPLDPDIFRHSPVSGADRHQRFMGAVGDDLGPPLPAVTEGSIPLLMNPPSLLGPDRGIVLHLTDLPAECSIGRLIDFLQPAPISPNYVRVLAFPDGACSGEAFVKVFHPHDADLVMQCDRRLWAGQLVRVWKSSEKYMEDAVAAFESQFVDYDSSRSVRTRSEPLLERPRWRPRYEGHDGLPAL